MIKSTADGVIIDVRVIPRSRKSEVVGTREDAFLVRLNAPPVDGAANAELVDVLAKVLQVAKRSISIVAGETSRLKRVRVTGIDSKMAMDRLSIDTTELN